MPFPDPESLEPRPETEAGRIAASGMEEAAREYEAPPELPRCRGSRTTRTPTRLPAAGGKEKHLYDILFVRERDVPFQYNEAFGEDTVVRIFPNEGAAPLAFAVRPLGVRCLPHRMRVTRHWVFRDEGDAALRNYEQNPLGPGRSWEEDAREKAETPAPKVEKR